MKKENIKKIILEQNRNAIFIEKEFDVALIGYGCSCGGKKIAIYNSDDCIKILIKNHNMDEIEAYEHFSKSIELSEKNENKPIFINNFKKTKDFNFNLDNVDNVDNTKENNIIDFLKNNI